MISERLSLVRPRVNIPGVSSLLFSPAARPLRFAGTGLVAAATQLALLDVFTRYGWDAFAAETAAFLLAAQINLGLSLVFTWWDRPGSGGISRRWLLFHGSIALTAALNLLVFSLTRSIMPLAAASLAGIAAGSVGNYLASDRLVFRRRHMTLPAPTNQSHRLRYSDATE